MNRYHITEKQLYEIQQMASVEDLEGIEIIIEKIITNQFLDENAPVQDKSN